MFCGDSRVPLALDVPFECREALLPVGFERVPRPTLHLLQSLTPCLFKLPSPEECPLPIHPATEREVLLAVVDRHTRMSLALDVPLKRLEAILPGRFVRGPYPARQSL